MKNGRIILLSNCAVCGSKKINFFKEQEAVNFGNLLKLATVSFTAPFKLLGI